MPFQFLVKKSGHIPAADVWLLDGELMSGEIRNDTSAIAQTEAGPVEVSIKTVAFVNTKNSSGSDMTLTIAQPDYSLELLEGTVLVNG